MVTVASRSSLAGALLRNVSASQRLSLLNYLRGLSRDELECLAEFEGARIIEKQSSTLRSVYSLLADFFDSMPANRWVNPDEKAHKLFIVLEYLNLLHHQAIRVSLNPR